MSPDPVAVPREADAREWTIHYHDDGTLPNFAAQGSQLARRSRSNVDAVLSGPAVTEPVRVVPASTVTPVSDRAQESTKGEFVDGGTRTFQWTADGVVETTPLGERLKARLMNFGGFQRGLGFYVSRDDVLCLIDEELGGPVSDREAQLDRETTMPRVEDFLQLDPKMAAYVERLTQDRDDVEAREAQLEAALRQALDALAMCRDNVPFAFWSAHPEYANQVEEAENDAREALTDE